MKYFFRLDGSNFDLSFYELKALLDIYDINHRVLKKDEEYRIVIADCEASEKEIKRLCVRSTLIKFSGKLIGKIHGLELEDFEDVNWGFVEIPFAVRVEDFGKIYDKQIEGRVASVIWWDLEERGRIPRVNLDMPKTLVYFFVTSPNDVYVVDYIWRPAKGRFKEREPHKRPGFHPASLKPKFARLLINLSRGDIDKKLLDCFCGVGGVLIESSLLGCKTYGLDMDAKMIAMSKKNLKHYNAAGEVKQGDARAIEKSFKGKFDCIATDPPYGRSSSLGKIAMNDLYDSFLTSCWKVLKKGSYLAMIYPHYGFMRN